MRQSLIAFLLAAFFTAHAATATADVPAQPELTPAERELADLMNDYYANLEVYWAAPRNDDKTVDPNIEFIPRLLKFEEAHRGDDAGLVALWHVFKEAARGGKSDAPAIVGRQQAVTRLEPYAKKDLLPIAVRTALLGNFEPAAYDATIKLLDTHSLSPASEKIIRFHLASDALTARKGREFTSKRMEELRTGAKPNWPGELDYLADHFKSYPPAEEVNRRSDAALQILEELSQDKASPRMPGLKGIDERSRIVHVTNDPAQPLLSEKATAVIFKEQNLKIGAAAPDLEVKLVDESKWRLADQHGKVVVIQFSFTGCGPCEAMYPELAKLATEYGDRITVLTIMSDPTDEHAQKAIASGKFTWNIAIDGSPGHIATQWSVTGFPETYIIDQKNTIAAVGLQGESLQKKVADLLDAPE